MYSRENEQTNREATNNNPKNLKFTSWGVKKPLQQQQLQNKSKAKSTDNYLTPVIIVGWKKALAQSTRHTIYRSMLWGGAEFA